LAESLIIDKEFTQEERYKLLVKQMKNLLSKEDHLLSNLSNFTSALKSAFDKISWVGFYIFDGNRLYLGPFQGNIACTSIKIGKGVCGTAAQKKETLIVAEVNKFPGHISCDPNSKSEIVVPILKKKGLYGVLDLDSYTHNAFNETDQKYLEELCSFLSSEIL
jgi:L-methionine (R)-S-oxide reductase